METSLLVTLLKIMEYITYVIPPLMISSLLFLPIAIVYDLVKRRFHWTKWAIIALVAVFLIIFMEIALTYSVTNNIK